MTIIPRSIVHWERLQQLLNYRDEERDSAYTIAAAITGACEGVCNRDFLRDDYTDVLDGYNDEKIRLRNAPVHSLTSVRYSLDRGFSEDDEVDSDRYFLDTTSGDIYFDFYVPPMKRIVKVTYDAGWTLPEYIGPGTPETPSEGQVWLKDDDSVVRYETDSWVAYETEILPEYLQAAVIEYITWYKRRLKTREVGVKTKDRGYTFEGSSIEYETMMPGHIREMLSKAVRF